MIVLEATACCIERWRGPASKPPTSDWASAEAAQAAHLPRDLQTDDIHICYIHASAADAHMFWSITLRAFPQTSCISDPPPPEKTRSRSDRFPGRGTLYQSSQTPYVSPLLHPSSPAINVHTISSKKKQRAPSPTTPRHIAACFFSGILRTLAELAILRSARPRRLAGHGYTVSYEGAHLHLISQCQSCAFCHPSRRDAVEVTPRVR